MQDKTWYSILGLDAEPLFLQDDMLRKYGILNRPCCTYLGFKVVFPVMPFGSNTSNLSKMTGIKINWKLLQDCIWVITFGSMKLLRSNCLSKLYCDCLKDEQRTSSMLIFYSGEFCFQLYHISLTLARYDIYCKWIQYSIVWTCQLHIPWIEVAFPCYTILYMLLQQSE